MKTNRITSLSVVTALALIAFMIESLFPPLFLPGAKMGISNIFTLLALLLFGFGDAFVVLVVRTVLGSIFMGNISSLMYSFSAGFASLVASAILIKWVFPKISIISISVASAVLHNIVQNLVFCLVSKTPQMISYMPYLALIGILAGTIVGVAVKLIISYVPLRFFAEAAKEDDTTAQIKNEQQ